MTDNDTDTVQAPPAPIKRVGTQLLVSPEQRARQVRLAAATNSRLAEVGRKLFEIALPIMEDAHEIALKDLQVAAEGLDIDSTTLADRMLEQKVELGDLFYENGGDYFARTAWESVRHARDIRRAGL